MAKEAARWAICYINPSMLHLLSVDLRKQPKYRSVEAYIPTVDMLKKQLKGKDHFEKVPLLFNYGFFKVPKYFIPNPHFLDQMEEDIRCIFGWVKDPLLKYSSKPILKYGLTLHNPKNIALATAAEMRELKRAEKSQTIYTAKDLETLHPGKIIVLKKYPFENLPAEIVSIDIQRKEVKVKLCLDTTLTDKPIKVSFDNIFYSVYLNYLDLEMKEKSIEDVKQKRKKPTNDEDSQ